MDPAGAGALGGQHPGAVDARGHPVHELLRHGAELGGPEPAHQLLVAADAAGREQHRRGVLDELAGHLAARARAARGVVGREHLPAHPGDAAVLEQQLAGGVPGAQHDPAGLAVRGELPRERLDDPGAGPPGDVEAGHGVAVPLGAAVAAFGPAHHREAAVAQPAQPVPLLAGRELQVRLGPAAGPVVLGAVEGGGAEPVLPGEVQAVADPQAALLGGVHHEQPAEAPPGLPAEVLLPLPLEEQHAPAGVGDLGGGDQARQSRADDDHVGGGPSVPGAHVTAPGSGARA